MRIVPIILILLLLPLVHAAKISGTIYDSNFEVAQNVLVEVDSVPQQQVLATNGNYQFDLPMGEYTLIARNSAVRVTESVNVVQEGNFVLDIFLIPDLSEEDDLWLDTEEELFSEEITLEDRIVWPFVLILLLILIVLFIFVYKKKRKKTTQQHKEELENEPGDLDRVVDIIKKHEGRISQKDLRKEMLPLSEAKVSLLVTELEHNGKIEKVKKGRGNVLILK